MNEVYIVIETYCTQETTVNATPCTTNNVAEQVMEKLIESYRETFNQGECTEKGCANEGWWRIEDPFTGWYAEVELCNDGPKTIYNADNIKDFKP